MNRRPYVPPIEIKVGQSRAYQKRVDAMTCKVKGCKRWRVDVTTKFCADHRCNGIYQITSIDCRHRDGGGG